MIEVEFIGGVDEEYMLTYSDEIGGESGFYAEHLILSLEDVQDMIFQFKKLLKPVQFKEAVYKVETIINPGNYKVVFDSDNYGIIKVKGYNKDEN